MGLRELEERYGLQPDFADGMDQILDEVVSDYVTTMLIQSREIDREFSEDLLGAIREWLEESFEDIVTQCKEDALFS